MAGFSTRRLGGLAAVMVVASLFAAPPARAMETIVQDDALFLHGGEERIRTGLERARALGMTRVRLTAGWSVIAPHPDLPEDPDFAAEDPAAYPAENWMHLDRAVRMIEAAGLKAMIDVGFWAPRWATEEPPETPDRMAREVDPVAFGRFARAVATRYSGSWTPPPRPAEAPSSPQPAPDRPLLERLFGGPDPEPDPEPQPDAAPAEPLPAVDLFTIWNEPNHPGFLRPQWVRGSDGHWRARSAEIYRSLVRAGYPAIKAAAPHARVLIGATAAMGSSTPELAGVPPMRFLRELACVDTSLRPVTAGSCAGFERLPGDGWSHHPYSLRTTPDVDTRDTDKAPVAGTARLAGTLRALVRAGRLAPGVADVWLTEYGYETNRPDPNAPFSLEDQGRLLAWAEHIASREPAVKSWPQFQLYDRPDEAPRPGMRPFGDWHSGLYFNDGSPKPSASTYATPIHAGCAPGRPARRVTVWGRDRTRTAAHVALESSRAGGSWSSVLSTAVPQGAAVTRSVRHRAGTVYRLRWTGPAGERTSPAADPAATGCRAETATAARRARSTRARRAARKAAVRKAAARRAAARKAAARRAAAQHRGVAPSRRA